MPRAPVVLAILIAASATATAQSIYKCTTAKGTVTYQETPCPVQGSQKRVDTSHGAAADSVAREMLEREAYRGDPLAREFLEEARERDRRERLEREERLRRSREKETRGADESPEWMPPWGWAGRPGLARPKTKPAP